MNFLVMANFATSFDKNSLERSRSNATFVITEIKIFSQVFIALS
jgi:hypothetical protein